MFLSAGISIVGLAPGVRTTDTLEEACQFIPRRPSEDVLIICGSQSRTRAPRVARAVAEHDRVAVVTVLGTPTRQAAIAALLLSIPTAYLGVAQAVADAAQSVVETRVAPPQFFPGCEFRCRHKNSKSYFRPSCELVRTSDCSDHRSSFQSFWKGSRDRGRCAASGDFSPLRAYELERPQLG